MATVTLSRENLMPVMGFNSKHWYIYDEENDVYIDPPSAFLKEVEKIEDVDDQEAFIYKNAINNMADWLYDVKYWYSGDTEI